MTISTRTLAHLFVLAACGPVSSTTGGESSASDTSSTSEGSQGEGTTGDESTTTESETTEGSGGSETTGTPDLDMCIVDGVLVQPLAVVDTSAAAIYVYEPGSEPLTLSATIPEGIDDISPQLAVDAAGNYIAVVSNYAVSLGPGEHEIGAVVRLFERGSATPSWSRTLDHRLNAIYVDDLGRVTGTVGWNIEPGPVGMYIIDGEVQELAGLAPAGPIGPEGWIPGHIYAGQEQVGTGFYSPETDTLVQITNSPNPTGWRIDGETIEYIDNEPSVPRLVLAGPASEEVIALDPFAEATSPISAYGFTDDFRLLDANFGTADDPERRLYRLQVSSGILTPIEVTPPNAYVPFDCYFQVNAIDADGRVLFEYRNPGAAQIFAWDPDATTWTALGEAMTEVEDIMVQGNFDRVAQIHGFGENTTYCIEAQWQDPPQGALEGSSIHLARIDPPLSLVVDAEGFGAVHVDPEEHCAAWVSQQTGSLRVHDLDDAEVVELEVSGWTIWLD